MGTHVLTEQQGEADRLVSALERNLEEFKSAQILSIRLAIILKKYNTCI